ncbi:MAG: HAMP domain-containing sensor histidine kinase [Candidatus Taylorbacteria bacterium]
MDSHLQLFIHNIGYIVSTLLLLFLIIVIYIKDHSTFANKMLIAGMLMVCVFTISHVIGVNITDPHLSRNILMFNTSVLFLTCFLAHSAFALINKLKEQRLFIIGMYTISIGLFFVYILFPDTFLLDSVPKMYFPNYYVAGDLQWIMRLFSNILIPAYFIYQMIREYRVTSQEIKNRLRYIFTGFIFGFGCGFAAIPLVFGYQLNPIWSIFFVPLFMIPVTYGIVTYNVFDITFVAKKAFVYAISVVGVGILIIGFDYTNTIVRQQYPQFPLWIIPLISSILAVTLGFIVWRQLKENELLKYEFVTTVTHKFRTPLTHIKWASENLSQMKIAREEREQIGYIQNANLKLVELTNLLMNVSETENKSYNYVMQKNDLGTTIKDVLTTLTDQIQAKHVNIIEHLEPNLSARYDPSRIKFIIQTFIENAIHYTSDSPTITISARRDGARIICSIADDGIGISKEELPLLFSKFYRGSNARLADTEGMGIGLYMSREIIARHHGKIWAESEGANKGSSFNFSLPAIS